ncbi:hypothetical protein [Pseudoalteromonas sp. GW168-MNA-CIBAN-0100]|jgi:hypothetical protein|uniref:hypothetical protein n=1 Tax=Pseudoalteromonas sp. GW168-MNA-CIBAN-0100 TaxID=3140434 RepID=UPI00332403B6|tara:strand:- start:29461 stop:29646 length:186 start_codon:yes stop_codon:yes gene_type:complete
MISETAETYAYHREANKPTKADYEKAYLFFDNNNAKRREMGLKEIALNETGVPKSFRRGVK